MNGWDYRGQQPRFPLTPYWRASVRRHRVKPMLQTSNDEHLCELPSARQRVRRLAFLSKVNKAHVTFSNASLTSIMLPPGTIWFLIIVLNFEPSFEDFSYRAHLNFALDVVLP